MIVVALATVVIVVELRNEFSKERKQHSARLETKKHEISHI